MSKSVLLHHTTSLNLFNFLFRSDENIVVTRKQKLQARESENRKRIKEDPIKYQEYLNKERERKKMARRVGKIPKRSQTTEGKLAIEREKTRERVRKWREKQR